MTQNSAPWVRGRGMRRLLAQENNVSDLIQFLSDRDSSPWEDLIGFAPVEVEREVRSANNADLLLTAGERQAVVEVKVGHLMDPKQQEKYEALKTEPDLYLAAMEFDKGRLAADSKRWSFLSLSDLVSRWTDSGDDLARLLAEEAARILREWDEKIFGVFETRDSGHRLPLNVLDQKFLARVVTRRIAEDVKGRRRLAWAGVTSGGGLPLVQAWTPIRDEGKDRTFMAEVRWWETKPGGELRFGVDFDPRPDGEEDEEVRRAAYDLARSMESDIQFSALKEHLTGVTPSLAALLRRDTPSRPPAKGDWEKVIVHGFKGTVAPNGKKNTRRQTTPDFFGDGALRFQAIAEIDFNQAAALDLVDLIDSTLSYLSARQPES